jgi:hypothetical protein
MSVSNRAQRMGRSIASRRVVTYRSHHFTGYVPSIKNERMIQYESILERDYIQLIESDLDVVGYTEQPTPLTWSDGVENYTTTFDFEVKRVDGRLYLVEVKPLSKVIKYGLDELYGFARAAAIASKYSNLELWTDREIRAMPRLLNAELLVAASTTFRDDEVQHKMRSAVLDLQRLSDRTTIGGLRLAAGLGNAAYWAIIRMIAGGELIPINPSAALDDDAVVRFAGGRI